MSLGESMNSRNFEVWCGRCDVTFPVGTKRCVHCGGATASGRGHSMRPSSFGKREGGEDSANASPFEIAYGIDTEEEEFVVRDAPSEVSSSAGGATGAEEAGSSPVKSLIQSMGGIIWILLLVGFSLARSCGGE